MNPIELVLSLEFEQGVDGQNLQQVLNTLFCYRAEALGSEILPLVHGHGNEPAPFHFFISPSRGVHSSFQLNIRFFDGEEGWWPPQILGIYLLGLPSRLEASLTDVLKLKNQIWQTAPYFGPQRRGVLFKDDSVVNLDSPEFDVSLTFVSPFQSKAIDSNELRFDLPFWIKVLSNGMLVRLKRIAPDVYTDIQTEMQFLMEWSQERPLGLAQFQHYEPSKRNNIKKKTIYAGIIGSLSWTGVSCRLIRYLDWVTCMGAGKQTAAGQGGVCIRYRSTPRDE